MKDPMKPRDKITQKNEPRRADRAKPVYGAKASLSASAYRTWIFRKRRSSKPHRTRRSFKGRFPRPLPCPTRRSIFQSRRTQPPSASWSISARDRPGKRRKRLSGGRRKRQRQRRSRPSAIYRRGTGTPELEKYIKNRAKPPTVWTQRGRHFPQRRNRGCNLTSRKRRELRGQAQSLIPPRAGSRDFRPQQDTFRGESQFRR